MSNFGRLQGGMERGARLARGVGDVCNLNVFTYKHLKGNTSPHLIRLFLDNLTKICRACVRVLLYAQAPRGRCE